MTILGVIPARGGSKALPGKNLTPLGDRSLVARAIEQAKDSTLLTDFLVTSDDPAIMREAGRFGALVVPRPADLARDDTGMVPVIQHAVVCRGGPRPDLIVTLQPTSPFRTGKRIDETIRKVLDTGADSAQTVTLASYHPFFMVSLDGDKTVPLFRLGANFVTRQSAPAIYQPNGAVYVTRYRTLMEQHRIVGEDNRAVICEPEESVNINTRLDWLLAEALL